MGKYYLDLRLEDDWYIDDIGAEQSDLLGLSAHSSAADSGTAAREADTCTTPAPHGLGGVGDSPTPNPPDWLKEVL